MDEIWERAVETALDGQTVASVRTLTLDGAVKCVHGRLPHPALFQKFPDLQHLSIANTGVSSLEQFPRLQNLQKLILSDNRIAGGLEYLVEAGLESLRDLDLSNNRIQEIVDLSPLADLKVVSLDLYECPVTRVNDYRSRVFGLIKSLKYLDKMDVDENERPESDEDDDEEEGDGDDEEDDPGSGEIDGEEKQGPNPLTNGHVTGHDGVVDVDEDDESDADEEESEIVRGSLNENGTSVQVKGFHAEPANVEDDDDDDADDDEGNDSDEIDEDEEDVIEVHEINESDDDDEGEDGVDDNDDDDEEEVDNDDLGEPGSTGWVTSTEGEIDGHEQGDDDVDEDDDGETGEEEIGVEQGDFEELEDEEEEEEEEDNDTGYLVQPVDMNGVATGDEDEEDDPEVEEKDDDDDVVHPHLSLSSKRKRDGDDDDDDHPKSSKQK